jgi:hypothetical protein
MAALRDLASRVDSTPTPAASPFVKRVLVPGRAGGGGVTDHRSRNSNVISDEALVELLQNPSAPPPPGVSQEVVDEIRAHTRLPEVTPGTGGGFAIARDPWTPDEERKRLDVLMQGGDESQSESGSSSGGPGSF